MTAKKNRRSKPLPVRFTEREIARVHRIANRRAISASLLVRTWTLERLDVEDAAAAPAPVEVSA